MSTENLTEGTLPDECYSDGHDPFFFWDPDEDSDYDFCWNGIPGDPIQVESKTEVKVVDIIPTDAEHGMNLKDFQLVCESYLLVKKSPDLDLGNSLVVNNGPSISGSTIKINWEDGNGNVVSTGTITPSFDRVVDEATYEEKKPPKSDEEKYQDAMGKLSDLLPDLESPR